MLKGKLQVEELYYHIHADADLVDDFNEEYYNPVNALKLKYSQLEIIEESRHHNDKPIH